MNRLFDGARLRCFSCFDLTKEDRSFNHHKQKNGRKKVHSMPNKGEKTVGVGTNGSINLGFTKKMQHHHQHQKRTFSSPNLKATSSPSSSPPNLSPSSLTFQELANATNNFSPRCLLRQEQFGSVYKGTLANGQVVAIKRLDGNSRQCSMRLLIEVLILNCLIHPNIVRMIGYCPDGDRRLLVYEHLPLGLLTDHLHDLRPDQEPLDWSARMKIAAGAAKALEYLHDKAKPQVIFRDFNSSSVLLDEGCSPKIYNFGLAKVCSVKNESDMVVGTQGYCAPEQAEPGQVTVKSDLYSFGVVLLELISGRKAIDTTKPEGEQSIVEWARSIHDNNGKNIEKLADPRMKGKFPRGGLCQAVTLATVCIREDPDGRPPVSKVATTLACLETQSKRPDEDGGSQTYADCFKDGAAAQMNVTWESI